PHVLWHETPLVISRRAVRAVLFYLAAQSAPVPRDKLCLLFWGDSPDDVARLRLRRMLSQLRQALADNGAPPKFVEVDEDSVWLQEAERTVDYLEFESAVRAMRSATGPAELIAAGDRALGHYLGEF